MLAGAEEAADLYEKASAVVKWLLSNGSEVSSGAVVLEAKERASALHATRRVAQVLVPYMSSVATYTRMMIEAAHRVNPRVVVATTRQAPRLQEALAEGRLSWWRSEPRAEPSRRNSLAQEPLSVR